MSHNSGYIFSSFDNFLKCSSNRVSKWYRESIDYLSNASSICSKLAKSFDSEPSFSLIKLPPPISLVIRLQNNSYFVLYCRIFSIGGYLSSRLASSVPIFSLNFFCIFSKCLVLSLQLSFSHLLSKFCNLFDIFWYISSDDLNYVDI